MIEKPDKTPVPLVIEEADSDEPTAKATYIPEVIGMHFSKSVFFRQRNL